MNRIGRGAVGALFLSGFGTTVLQGQAVARVLVAASAAGSLDSNSCRVDRTSQSKAKVDTLIVQIVKDEQYDSTALAKLSFPVEVHLENRVVRTINADSSVFHIDAGPAGLLEQRLSLWGPHSIPLCLLEPFPRRPSYQQAKPFSTRTDIIATGEVSTALKTGADNAGTTGSLGFHHQSFPAPGDKTGRFPWFFVHGPAPDTSHHLARPMYYLARWTSIPLSGEDLRALISVASTVDSVTGPAGAPFAQSLLLPSTAPNSGWKFVDLSYSPFYMYGRGHQTIGPEFRIVAAESRWLPDSTKLSKAKIAALVATDVRLKATLINRVSETDDNNLSFSVDVGYIERRLGGDASDTPAFVRAALGDSTRTRFAGWAIGTYLRLRQVTAFADFQCLSCRPFRGSRSGTKIESLEGLQPVIGFRFEAPFFSLADK